MAVTTPLGTGKAYCYYYSSSPSSGYSLNKKLYTNNNNTSTTSVSLRQFVGHKRFSQKSSSSLCCSCSINSNNNSDVKSIGEVSVTESGSGGSSSKWDWNRWVRHFSEVEQFETNSAVLKFQLEAAIEKEDFGEAARLKAHIAKTTSRDTVAEIMSELKKAIDEERYHDASKLSRTTGSGLVGWWVGVGKDSEDPFGRLVRITPGIGKFIGRTYTPRQLITASPGTTLFEIYVVKDTDGTYIMQVVYLQKSKESPSSSAILQPKPTRDPKSETEDSSSVDTETDNDKSEKQDEEVLNIEGATEEGVKSVLNFFKDKIPGLKVKVTNISVEGEVLDDDAMDELTLEDSELDIEDEDEDADADEDADIDDIDDEDELDDLDEIDDDTDQLTVGGGSGTMGKGRNMDVKVFLSGVLHSEDDTPSKEDLVRVPAQIKDAEKDSFVLHVPGIRETEESKASKIKVAAVGISELMPSDVAKAFLGTDKISPKMSRDVREIVKSVVNQAQKRSRLSEFTGFSKINVPRGNSDTFDGLYVGAFGPYGTEIVQLRRKFGHWNSESEQNGSSEIEFFEYVEAVKLTGDLNVPAGQVTFRAKIGKGGRLSNRGVYPDEVGVVASYKGQGRIAKFGYKDPKWVEGELLQLNGKGMKPYFRGADLGFLYVVPGQSFLVLFNRLNLPQ